MEASERGRVRSIGVTGHGERVAAMHLRSLERFDFDSVLLPYDSTVMRQAAYAADFEALYALCRERNVAIQTIEAIARRRWREGDTTRRFSGHEPLREREASHRAVRFTLARPGPFLDSSSDATLPLEVGAAAGEPAPPTGSSCEECRGVRLLSRGLPRNAG